MKNEQKQAFNSIDTIGLFASLALVMLVVGPILGRRVDQGYAEIARRQAQAWTEKIPQGEKFSQQGLVTNSGRTPASESSAASFSKSSDQLDPWGNPYRFQYIRNANGQPVYLAVWSVGPNSQSETTEDSLKIEEGSLSARFSGDDVGFVRALR